MVHWDLFWGRHDLCKRDRLHLNWRATTTLAGRFASATREEFKLNCQGNGIQGRNKMCERLEIDMEDDDRKFSGWEMKQHGRELNYIYFKMLDGGLTGKAQSKLG